MKCKRAWHTGHRCSKPDVIKNTCSRIASGDKPIHFLTYFINSEDDPQLEQKHPTKEESPDTGTPTLLEEFKSHFKIVSTAHGPDSDLRDDTDFTRHTELTDKMDALEQEAYALRISSSLDFHRQSRVQDFRYGGKM